eukprot:COSAG02_NODE_20372_length_834_cov_1.944218_1_plen_32_part_10
MVQVLKQVSAILVRRLRRRMNEFRIRLSPFFT